MEHISWEFRSCGTPVEKYSICLFFEMLIVRQLMVFVPSLTFDDYETIAVHTYYQEEFEPLKVCEF